MRTKPILSAKQLTPLIEIILAMVFFSVASTVLVQVFAKAHNDSRFAHDINNATLFVGECAENIHISDDYGAVLDALYSSGFEMVERNHLFHAYFDTDFSPAPRDTAYSTVTFELSAKDTEAGQLLTGQFICARKDGKELVNMETAVFLPDS